MKVSGEVVFGLFMLTLGAISVVFRRVLVRWHSALFWSNRPVSPEVTRRREVLQFIVGVILASFGIAFLFFLS